MEYKRQNNESAEDFICRVVKDKNNIGTWTDIANIVNAELGYTYTESWYRHKFRNIAPACEKQNTTDLNKCTDVDELRKERLKIQALNIERNKVDREEARRELYFENIGKYVRCIEPVAYEPVPVSPNDSDISYVLTISDLHYGSVFSSSNNAYSPLVCKERLELLLAKTKQFVENHGVQTLYVANLGDTIEGLIHVTDVKLNSSSMVKAVVEVSHLIARFLVNLSSFVNVIYIHVPQSNHTQIRPLGTKANDVPYEDVEYIIGHYIKDLCSKVSNIDVHLMENNLPYFTYYIDDYCCVFTHGHNIKNIKTAINDITDVIGSPIDYLITGHRHEGKIVSCAGVGGYDTEVIVCPSIMGNDPYSDMIMKHTEPSAQILGFGQTHGHIETYKIVLS